jgi:SRSO17 transposase
VIACFIAAADKFRMSMKQDGGFKLASVHVLAQTAHHLYRAANARDSDLSHQCRTHARQYLHGLLSPLEKKNSCTIGELADEDPKKLQRLLNLASWDADELLGINRRYAMEHFADPGAILVADPTGFAKKGKKSAGVGTVISTV